MTVAVIFTAGTDPGIVGELTARLSAQARAAGAEYVDVIARPAQLAALRGASGSVHASDDLASDLATVRQLVSGQRGPWLFLTTELVAGDAVLPWLATEPGDRTTALITTNQAPPMAGPEVAIARNRIVRVGWEGGPGTAFLGALRLVRADSLAVQAAGTDHGAAWNAGEPARTPIDALLAEVVAAGAPVLVSRARLLPAERITDADGYPSARARVAAVDEDAAALRMSVKEQDDFFATHAISTWSPHLTRLAARLRISPTTVTVGSVLLAGLAAAAFWHGSRAALIAGAALFYLSFVLDCVDGQLARYTRHFSRFGGWLDTMADRFKEYLVYAGLAAGAQRTGFDASVWLVAIAAMALQTVRHHTDAWYGALHDQAAERRTTTIPTQRQDPIPPVRDPAQQRSLGRRLGWASDRIHANAGSVAYWAKRTLVFPIGERWLVLGVAAALFDGRVALLALLGWAVLAALGTLGVRVLRSRSMRVPVLVTRNPPRHRDDGPLTRRVLGRVSGLRAAPLPLAVLAVLGAGGLAGLAVFGPALPAYAPALAALVMLPAVLAAGAPHGGPLDWLVPAALRAADYLFVVAAGMIGGVAAPLIFALLLVLAIHHYDLLARMEQPAVPAGMPVTHPGWEGRVLLLVAGVAAGLATEFFAGVLGYFAGMLAVGVISTLVLSRRLARAERRPAAGWLARPGKARTHAHVADG